MFEQLLPEPYNSSVQTMLFELCQWHAFAKLALHSDDTLTDLEAALTMFHDNKDVFIELGACTCELIAA